MLYKITEDTDLYNYDNNYLVPVYEDQVIKLVKEKNGKMLFDVNGDLCWQYNYSIEDKIQKI